MPIKEPEFLSEPPAALPTWTPDETVAEPRRDPEQPSFEPSVRKGATPKRYEGTVLGILGVLLLLGGAVLPWWRLAAASEPLYITACRLMSGLLAVIAGIFLLQPVRRAGPLVLLGGFSFLLPLLVILALATVDGSSMSEAVHEVKQARRLMNYVEAADINPEVAWNPEVTLSATAVLRNDYTLVDACETGLNFTKGGWYLAVIGGSLIWVAAWMLDSRASRTALAKGRVWIGLAAFMLVTGITVPLGVGHFYWNRARLEAGQTDYAAALADYQRAAHWDHRFKYDLIYHYELGRLYGQMGWRNEPDYWAMMAEMYLSNNEIERGYQLYRRNIPNPRIDPTLRIRYANTLLKVGCIDYDTMQPGEAVDLWQRAYRLDPNNQEIIYALGMGYTQIGQYSSAIGFWQKLIDLNNDTGLSRNKYVSSYTFTKAVVGRAWEHMSYCYYQQRDFSSAMRYKMMSMQMGGKLNPVVSPDSN